MFDQIKNTLIEQLFSGRREAISAGDNERASELLDSFSKTSCPRRGGY